MNDNAPLADDVPFEISEVDTQRAIVRFAEHVDHRRTPELESQLEQVLRKHRRVACDVSGCQTIDSDWLTLIHDLTLEARDSGKRWVVVGLGEVLKKSADILGLEGFDFADSHQEAWQ